MLFTGAALVVVVGLAGGAFFVGFRYGEQFPRTILIHGVSNLDGGKPAVVDFSTFWDAWSVVSENYLNDKTITNKEKLYGSIRGLVASLNDPYSEFFTPAENNSFEETINGNFGGIGAELGIKDGVLTIIAPLKNTPAIRAGLEPGDKILMINASSTDGMTTDQAVKLIRGVVKTEVKLTIMREGWEKPKEFKIIRDIIQIPTIDFEMRGDIAIIKLHSFNAIANQLFAQAAQNALYQGAKGIVLDLRNDPGGLLDVAVDMASWFLPRNTLVVSKASRTGPNEEFRAHGNAELASLPLVLVVNKGSASASEILAGSLRDNRGAKLVGERTFGKGTVQQLLSLRDGSSVKITIAHWVLPKGQILEKEGLKADIEVKQKEDEIKNGKDPQLDKAIEILKGEMR